MPAAGGPRGRSLTIGEAVAQLAAEFPGIRPETLRLLEQQGTVVPARTSSGYRRYAERDLEAVRRALSGPPRPRAGGGLAAVGVASATAAESAAARSTLWRSAASPARTPAADVATTASPPRPAPALRPVPPAAPRAVAEPEEPLSGPSQGNARRRAARWPDSDYFTPDLGEVSFGREGLARAAGITQEWVDELRAHGLIRGCDPASGTDLLVARAAAELIGFGIEPRHLTTVRIAAGRAADLVKAAAGPGPSRPGTASAAAALVRLEAALLRAALLDD